ncbi:unnamed protein product [Callosobruchus maculatus]|uniref:BESS domain-containing protein n=1 Tax=Callosobruchus maculatus TaxID=64391 RepID=A0A653DND2_CALMS|nr:unnamed protein product [Callosobruchus maculatus]
MEEFTRLLFKRTSAACKLEKWPKVKKKTTSSNMDEEQDVENTESPSTPYDLNKPSVCQRKNIKKVSSDVHEIIKILKSGMQSREQIEIAQRERERALENDGDRLFVLSLLEPLKEVPHHLRYKVRMQLMQVIENARYQNPRIGCTHEENGGTST